MTKQYIILILFGTLLGCSEPNSGEIETNDYCNDNIIVEGVKESFCNGAYVDFKSNLETVDGFYVQYKVDHGFGNRISDNFEAYNIAFANIIPDSSDWDSEAEFFENLINLLRPETKHRLDINELGGFAIELWDLDGVYYSSEFGDQENDTFIETRKMTLTYEGPTYSQVYNHLKVNLVSTKPILVWNQSGTKSLTVYTDYLSYLISFEQYR